MRPDKKNISKETSDKPKEASQAKGELRTPAAYVFKNESVNDVAPAVKVGVAGNLGYNYYEYEYVEPIDYMPQILQRVIRLSPYFYHSTGSGVPTKISNIQKLVDVWLEAPQLMLDRVLKRDDTRFLPDSFDNPGILEKRECLVAGLGINLRNARTLIDTASFNDGTKYIRSAWARKNRRCAEAEANLATIETAALWRALANTEPIIAPRDGGPILVTWVDLSDLVMSFGTENDPAHPCFIDRVMDFPNCDDWICTSAGADAILAEIENGIKIIRYMDNLVAVDGDLSGGWTWDTSTGRGMKADMKYWYALLTELEYPSYGETVGGIKVDLGLWNHKLYGECLYGVDLKTGTPDVRHPVAYPLISTGDKGVLRRSFTPLTLEIEIGADEPWAAIEGSTTNEFDYIVGLKCQWGVVNSGPSPTKFAIASMDRYGTWNICDGEYQFDDADNLRLWLEECPISDHQWNEGLFHRQDSFNQVRPDQPAVFSFHQDITIPFEGLRAMICEMYNVPFRR